MELIQTAMHRSQSRESARSGRSAEGTQTRHGSAPKDPTLNMGVTENYDDNYSVPGSEESMFPENYEQTKNDPIGKILLDIAHDQTMLSISPPSFCKNASPDFNRQNIRYIKIVSPSQQ